MLNLTPFTAQHITSISSVYTYKMYCLPIFHVVTAIFVLLIVIISHTHIHCWWLLLHVRLEYLFIKM